MVEKLQLIGNLIGVFVCIVSILGILFAMFAISIGTLGTYLEGKRLKAMRRAKEQLRGQLTDQSWWYSNDLTVTATFQWFGQNLDDLSKHEDRAPKNRPLCFYDEVNIIVEELEGRKEERC